MSDTILSPTYQTVQESMNGLVVHMDSKTTQEYPFIINSENVAEGQKITGIKSGNEWYQNDLSHMTVNLMRHASNTTALTINSENNQKFKY